MTLQEILERFTDLHILVAGDPMTDVYHFGRVDRLSPEAPVPVFVEESVSRRAGGAANVVAQLRALNVTSRSTFPPCEVWTEKHRYLVGHQQLFRVDHDFNVQADWSRHGDAKDWQALVISDYAKGALLGPMLEHKIAEFALAGVPIIVDPKGTVWTRYVGATVICPNDREMSGTWNGIPAVVHKRGALGLRLYGAPTPYREPEAVDGMGISRHFQDFPAKAKHVFDVTGAGDTVTAVIAATVAAGGTLEQACELANIAAGYVVGEVGTTVCPLEVLEGLIP